MSMIVVGGTSGLGLEIAKLLKKDTDSLVITGRTDPKQTGLTFVELPLESGQDFTDRLDRLVNDFSPFHTVVYNPGFYQEGRISDLTDTDIQNMVNVGFLAATLLLQRIMKKQETLLRFVAVTSTSQWIPRELEPVYTGVKAALGMFANSISLDPRIVKTLVVAPSGMKTKFWQMTEKDTSKMLDPTWVAEQIMVLLEGDFKYKYVRIMREPARVDIVESRGS